MNRRRFLAALAAGVLAAPSGVGADARLRRMVQLADAVILARVHLSVIGFRVEFVR